MVEKQKTDKIEVVVGTNESLANAIRRSINQIPVLAVEEAEIYKNDSALYDEIIAHRLGLIPLKEKRKLNEKDKCTCKGKGCDKCQIKLTLKAKGPATVYSGELKGNAEVVYDKMPIVILDKDQELELLCFVQLGKAVNHAKYSPGLVYYRNVSEIKVKDKEKAKQVIDKLKESIIGEGGGIYKCSKDIDYIETLIDDKDVIEVAPGKEIVFFVESWGQIKAKDIFNEAVKALNKNLNEVLKAVK